MSAPRYIFVAGLHRSGTSLVHRCLATHPAVASFAHTGVPEDEGQHLQDVLPTARSLGGPGVFARHPLAAAQPVTDARARMIRTRLLASWEPLWRADAAVRLTKSPTDLLRGPLLQQLFPGSTLVVLRRHPLAVAFATRAMAPSRRALQPIDLIEHWLIAHERLDALRPQLDRLVELRLDDLTADPERKLAELFACVGLVPPRGLPTIHRDPDARHRANWLVWRHTHRRAGLEADLERLAPRVLAQGYDLTTFARGNRGR